MREQQGLLPTEPFPALRGMFCPMSSSWLGGSIALSEATSLLMMLSILPGACQALPVSWLFLEAFQKMALGLEKQLETTGLSLQAAQEPQ